MPISPAALDIRLSCWPNESESLLLQAGLCERPKAMLAWRQFCAQIDDIETLDHSCYRLFPLVAGNLKGCLEELPHHARITGVLRHAWARNQHLLEEIVPLLQVLQNHRIDLLLLKGAAFLNLYRSRGRLRSLEDIDILIRPEDLERTAKILGDHGFSGPKTPSSKPLLELLGFHHDLAVKSPKGITLDVHWYLVSEAPHAPAEDDFWRDTVPQDLAGFSGRTLQLTDQFMHTCLHGAQWNEVPPVRWLADAAMLVDTGLDWDRLEKQARRLEQIEPVRDAILFLHRLEVRLPEGLVERWHKAKTTEIEKTAGSYRPYRPNSRERTKQLARIYLRLHKDRSFGELVWNLPQYMKHMHHYRAYSRRVAFLYYLILFSLKFRNSFARAAR